MTFFEKELLAMFGNSRHMQNIRCMGNTLFGKLAPYTIAKICFETTNTIGEYDRVYIRIINTQRGIIDEQYIDMADVFTASEKNQQHIRCDTFDGSGRYNSSPSWTKNIKPTPKDYENMHNEVEKYLEMFIEPVKTP